MTASSPQQHQCPNCGRVLERPTEGGAVQCKCGGTLVLPSENDDDLPALKGESGLSPSRSMTQSIPSDESVGLDPLAIDSAAGEPLDDANVVEYQTTVDVPGWSRGFVFVLAMLIYPGLLGVAEYFKDQWDPDYHLVVLVAIAMLYLPFCAFVARTARCQLRLKRYRLDQPRCARVQSVMGLPVTWRPFDLSGDSEIVLLIRRKGMGPIGFIVAVTSGLIRVLSGLFVIVFAIMFIIAFFPLFVLALILYLFQGFFGGGDSVEALEEVVASDEPEERLWYSLNLRDRKSQSILIYQGTQGGEVQLLVRRLRAATDLTLEFDAKTNASVNSLAKYLKSQYGGRSGSKTYSPGQLNLEQIRGLVPLAAPLLAIILSNKKAAKRAEAAAALGRIGRYANVVVPCLARSAVKDDSPDVRYQAVRALGMFGLESRLALTELAAATSDSHSRVAAEACESLGRLAGAAHPALPALRQAASSKVRRVRRAAITAMKRIAPGAARKYYGLVDWCGWVIGSLIKLLWAGVRVGFATAFLGAGLLGYCWAIPRAESIVLDYENAIENADVVVARGREQLEALWRDNFGSSLLDDDHQVAEHDGSTVTSEPSSSPDEQTTPENADEQTTPENAVSLDASTPTAKDSAAITDGFVKYVSTESQFACEYPEDWAINTEQTRAGRLQLTRLGSTIVVTARNTDKREISEGDRAELEKKLQAFVNRRFDDDRTSEVIVRLTKYRNRLTLSASFPLQMEGGAQARLVRFIEREIDCVVRVETSSADLTDAMKAFGLVLQTLTIVPRSVEDDSPTPATSARE